MARLTKRFIDDIQPTDKDQIYPDTEVPGLILKVTPAGLKTFSVRYRLRGKQCKPKLGTIGEITLDQARELARDHLFQVRKQKLGQAPLVASTTTPATTPTDASPVLSEAITKYLENIKVKGEETGKLYTYEEYKRVLEGDKFTDLQKRRMNTIKSQDLQKLHDAISRTGSAQMANKVVDLYRALFNYTSKRDATVIHPNPANAVDRNKRNKRERILSDAEFTRLGEAIDKVSNDGTTNQIHVWYLRLQLMMPARKTELLSLKWSDLDFDASLIKFKNTKGGKNLDKPMTTAVKTMLQAIPTKSGKFVFPSTRSKTGHIVSPAHIFEDIKLAAKIDNLTIHDMRRTFSSLGQFEGGVSKEIMAKVLGHANSNITEGHYQIANKGQKMEAAQATEDVISKKLRKRA